jgi:hypothetical protein
MIRELLKRVPLVRKVARLLIPSAPANDRRFLLETLPKGSIGAEIGVHLGDFSSQLLEAVQPRELYLIDPWAHESATEYRDAWYGGKASGGQSEMDARHASVCRRFAREASSGRVKIHRGYSGEVLGGFTDAYFDWVYIDGNHLYEFVKQDLELSFAKTKPGGYVCGDDYTSGGWWDGGVKRAVDEFWQTRGLQPAQIRNQQFILRR